MVPISCLRPQHSEETSIAAEIEFGVVTGSGNLFFHAILSAKPRSPLPLLGHFSRPLSAAADCTRWFQLPAPVKMDEPMKGVAAAILVLSISSANTAAAAIRFPEAERSEERAHW